MRVLVVDDEPLAQKALIRILEQQKEVERFDVAGDAAEVFEKLSNHSYDVLLLDVNMPELSGMELLDQLKKRSSSPPSVIFVTAHDEYAISAFEADAVDYVLKPFSNTRICEALMRAARRTNSDRKAKLIESFPRLRGLSPGKPPRIAIKSARRVVYMDLTQVSVIVAQGAFVRLQQGTNSYVIRESISAVTEKLTQHGFVRIHRSVLVNRTFVEEVKPYTTGEYGLRMRGGKQYTVSRGYKENLPLLAEFWIGSSAYFAQTKA